MPPRKEFSPGKSNHHINPRLRRLEVISNDQSQEYLMEQSFFDAITKGDLDKVQAVVRSKKNEVLKLKNSANKSALEVALDMLGSHPNALKIAISIINVVYFSGKGSDQIHKVNDVIQQYTKKANEKLQLLSILNQQVQIMTTILASPSSAKDVISPGLDLSKKRNRNQAKDDDDDDDNDGDNNDVSQDKHKSEKLSAKKAKEANTK